MNVAEFLAPADWFQPGGGPLHEALERHGRRPVRALQSISALNIAEPEALLLSVQPGAAGLRVERTSYLADGRVVESPQSLYRGDTQEVGGRAENDKGITMSTDTHMRREVQEIPAAVDRLLIEGGADMRAAGAALRDLDPGFMVSVARGSSDHAATFFKYVSELICGVPVASVGPSVASIYGRALRLKGSACLAVSQSGKSPDIVRMAGMAREAGSMTFALTNHPESDLAQVCDHTLNLHAGTELSVAATKTFVTSIVSAVWLLAELQQDADLLEAIRGLPAVLDRAAAADWSPLATELTARNSLYCLGRGPAFAISNEAALKFKETCLLHAESYSSAEVLHGPVSIVDQGFPVIGLAAADQAEAALIEVAEDLAGKGASVFVTSDKARGATALPVARTAHPLTDPVALIVSFYAMVEQVAVARGIDPDRPRHLRKVTETV